MIDVIKFTHKGDFNKTEHFLQRSASTSNLASILKKYGDIGVQALSAATPFDTGLTASSWGYTVQVTKNKAKVTWTNSNVVKGVPIAIILQYGHGTRNGGYVEGRDYINPAMAPIFNRIAEDMWTEVRR